MKKLLLTLALMLGTLTAANAQIGIIGGWTTAKTPSSISDLSPANGNLFHAGVAYKFDFGPFFTLQPELVYQGKASYVEHGGSTLYSRDINGDIRVIHTLLYIFHEIQNRWYFDESVQKIRIFKEHIERFMLIVVFLAESMCST